MIAQQTQTSQSLSAGSPGSFRCAGFCREAGGMWTRGLFSHPLLLFHFLAVFAFIDGEN